MVYGRARWIQEFEYDSVDALFWTDDNGNKQSDFKWTITTEPDGNLKYTYNERLASDTTGSGTGALRRITAHLPGRIVSSNADDVDNKKNVVMWEINNHRYITPTVTVQLSR
jgi:hypothetical protein